jgi:PKD repeat protein
MKGKIIVGIVVIIAIIAALSFTPLGQSLFNQSPIAEAGPDKTILVKKTVSFDGTGSKDPDGSIVKYSWSFGDGTSSEGSFASHAYASSGSYTVTLTVTDNKGATATDTCSVTVTYISLRTSVWVSPMQWQRNPTTDLPECTVTITYMVNNDGTASDTASALLSMDGITEKQQSFSINPGGSFSDQYITTVDYDTSHQFVVRADAWESSSSSSTRLEATLPRYMPIDYATLFITPRDPVIVQKEAEITTSWIIPDIVELRDWVAGNIKYSYDSQAHGTNDYWQLPRETISLKTGDCEDFAILLVSLLRANGYGSSDVYVMGGSSTSGGPGHAWVVVKMEFGLWWTIEPQQSTGEGIIWSILSGQLTEVSGYTAQYKFNDVEFYTIS